MRHDCALRRAGASTPTSVRRLLALAAIYDEATRTEAAGIGDPCGAWLKAGMLSGRMRRRLTTTRTWSSPHEAAAVLAQINPENRDLHLSAPFPGCPGQPMLPGRKGHPIP
jgi:hypothetical protein